jgi:hypothetical protein
MQLLTYRSIGKGMLLGKADIGLPNGLEINDVGIFSRADGSRWAQFPAEMLRDQDGRPILNDKGKPKYRTLIHWVKHETQAAWSDALIALVEAEHGKIGGAS